MSPLHRTLALALLIVTACGGGVVQTPANPPVGTTPGQATQVPIATSSPAASAAPGLVAPSSAFGFAPVDDGSITYQPDVVIVEGGADVIRSVTADGLTWTIDGAAGRASELAVGKIMLLTGTVAGRVIDLASAANGYEVTLGPADLGEIIRDGQLSVSSSLALDGLTTVSYPDSPLAFQYEETGMDEEGAGALPGFGVVVGGTPVGRFASIMNPIPEVDQPLPVTPRRSMPPPTTDEKSKASVGPFSVELARTSGRSGQVAVNVAYSKNGLTLGLDFVVVLEDPKVDMALDFAGGQPVSGFMKLTGLKKISIKVDAGTEAGLSSNFKARLEIPFDFPIQLATPVPMTVRLKPKFLIQPVFTAKNSVMSAEGAYTLNGDVAWSMSNGETTLSNPGVTTETSLMETLSGISVGVNGVVLAAQMKVLAGVGVPLFSAGPYAAITIGTGLTVGSDLGIVKCRQASLDVVAAGGFGYVFSSGDDTAVKKFLEGLGLSRVKLDSEHAGVTQTIYEFRDYDPKVAACQL